MKRLMLVLVFMAVLSATCYGVSGTPGILVYKMTANFNPWIDYYDGNTADVYPWNEVGYLVLNLSDVNAGTLASDPNVIRYGSYRVAGGVYKWYYSFIADESSDSLDIFTIEGTTNIGAYYYIQWNDGYDQGYSSVYGKCKKVDIGIGPKEKPNVPQSLKGIIERWGDDDYDGFGNVTITLDSKWTKTANDPCDAKGFDGNIETFLDPNSGPPDPKAKGLRGLINWLHVVQGYEED
jgi:hypothetical protein